MGINGIIYTICDIKTITIFNSIIVLFKKFIKFFKMTAEQILEKAKGIFNQPVKAEVKKVELGEIITDEGTTIYFDGELVDGSSIWVIVDGQNVPVPVGEYLLPDGKVLIVSEAGLLASISPAKSSETEEIEPEVEVAAEAEVEVAAEAEPTNLSAEDVATLIKEALKPLEEKITMLTEQKQEAETKIGELETKLSAEPATIGVVQSPEGKATAKGVPIKSTGKTGLSKVYEMLYS